MKNDNKVSPNLIIEILHEANLNFVEYDVDQTSSRINMYIDLMDKFITYKKNIILIKI